MISNAVLVVACLLPNNVIALRWGNTGEGRRVEGRGEEGGDTAGPRFRPISRESHLILAR